MRIGYCRVSTADQSEDLQKDALSKAHCDRIFSDVASGSKCERPGLAEAISHCRPGDTLVVWKLDRMGRSLQDLIRIMEDLRQKQIGFLSLRELIDTNTAGGKLVFHIFGALAEFEKALIQERTNAGLAAARARGRTGGRPRKLGGKRVDQARLLLSKNSPQQVADILGISKSTLYRAIRTGS